MLQKLIISFVIHNFYYDWYLWSSLCDLRLAIIINFIILIISWYKTIFRDLNDFSWNIICIIYCRTSYCLRFNVSRGNLLVLKRKKKKKIVEIVSFSQKYPDQNGSSRTINFVWNIGSWNQHVKQLFYTIIL